MRGDRIENGKIITLVPFVGMDEYKVIGLIMEKKIDEYK